MGVAGVSSGSGSMLGFGFILNTGLASWRVLREDTRGRPPAHHSCFVVAPALSSPRPSVLVSSLCFVDCSDSVRPLS